MDSDTDSADGDYDAYAAFALYPHADGVPHAAHIYIDSNGYAYVAYIDGDGRSRSVRLDGYPSAEHDGPDVLSEPERE